MCNCGSGRANRHVMKKKSQPRSQPPSRENNFQLPLQLQPQPQPQTQTQNNIRFLRQQPQTNNNPSRFVQRTR